MKNKTGARREPGSKRKLYPVESKRRVVQLYTEEGYTFHVLCREPGICKSSLGRWIKQYREQGPAAALNYILSFPNVGRVISGFRNERQVQCNLATAGRTLTGQDAAFIRTVFAGNGH